MPTEITLPSGLCGSIKELGIREENILTDPKQARSGKNLHRVLESCWEETLDPGIYNFGEKGFIIQNLLQGDGMALLIYLRIVSYGPEFFFDVNCPVCGQRIPWELDLNDFMEQKVKPLSEESKKIIRENNGLFECVLPTCKRKVVFRLMTLREEMRFPEIRRESFDQLSSTLLNMVVQSVEGIDRQRAFFGMESYPLKDYDGPTDVLTSRDASFLRDEMEEVGCGVFTTIDVECLDHGEVRVDLPFRENFLLPKRRKR